MKTLKQNRKKCSLVTWKTSQNTCVFFQRLCPFHQPLLCLLYQYLKPYPWLPMVYKIYNFHETNINKTKTMLLECLDNATKYAYNAFFPGLRPLDSPHFRVCLSIHVSYTPIRG